VAKGAVGGGVVEEEAPRVGKAVGCERCEVVPVANRGGAGRAGEAGIEPSSVATGTQEAGGVITEGAVVENGEATAGEVGATVEWVE
jgi:hypothetical protein